MRKILFQKKKEKKRKKSFHLNQENMKFVVLSKLAHQGDECFRERFQGQKYWKDTLRAAVNVSLEDDDVLEEIVYALKDVNLNIVMFSRTRTSTYRPMRKRLVRIHKNNIKKLMATLGDQEYAGHSNCILRSPHTPPVTDPESESQSEHFLDRMCNESLDICCTLPSIPSPIGEPAPMNPLKAEIINKIKHITSNVHGVLFMELEPKQDIPVTRQVMESVVICYLHDIDAYIIFDVYNKYFFVQDTHNNDHLPWQLMRLRDYVNSTFPSKQGTCFPSQTSFFIHYTDVLDQMLVFTQKIYVAFSSENTTKGIDFESFVKAFQTPVDDRLLFDIDRVAKDLVIPRKQLHDSCLDINMKTYIKSSMVNALNHLW